MSFDPSEAPQAMKVGTRRIPAPAPTSAPVDVLVVGGGNAGLCAAISARRAGASVLVLEAAPKFYRGGNTRHTRNVRCAHDEPNKVLTGPYMEDEFWDDLRRVTDGEALHLGVVFGFFITMPYGKFMHGIYRFAALTRYAKEHAGAAKHELG